MKKCSKEEVKCLKKLVQEYNESESVLSWRNISKIITKKFKNKRTENACRSKYNACRSKYRISNLTKENDELPNEDVYKNFNQKINDLTDEKNKLKDELKLCKNKYETKNKQLRNIIIFLIVLIVLRCLI